MMTQLDDVRSATEIVERREEKMVMLGPVLERLHDELLDPLIGRVFQIIARAGQIPPRRSPSSMGCGCSRNM